MTFCTFSARGENRCSCKLCFVGFFAEVCSCHRKHKVKQATKKLSRLQKKQVVSVYF